jgi:hypothetical protein
MCARPTVVQPPGRRQVPGGLVVVHGPDGSSVVLALCKACYEQFQNQQEREEVLELNG